MRLSRGFLALALWSASALCLAETLVLEASADNTLFEDAVDFSSGAGDFLFVGPIASGSPRRALLRFDLAALPPTAVVSAAELRLVVNRAAVGSSVNDRARLHRLTASWGEGSADGGTGGAGTLASPDDATWLRRFHGTPPGAPGPQWATPGGDFILAASADAPLGGSGSALVFSGSGLLADIAAWHAGQAQNHGWALLGPEGPTESQKARRLLARSAATLADRPRLTLTYTVPPPVTDPPVTRVPLPGGALVGLAVGLTLLAHRQGRARAHGGPPDST